VSTLLATLTNATAHPQDSGQPAPFWLVALPTILELVCTVIFQLPQDPQSDNGQPIFTKMIISSNAPKLAFFANMLTELLEDALGIVLEGGNGQVGKHLTLNLSLLSLNPSFHPSRIVMSPTWMSLHPSLQPSASLNNCLTASAPHNIASPLSFLFVEQEICLDVCTLEIYEIVNNDVLKK
jgi:hypothetical protein